MMHSMSSNAAEATAGNEATESHDVYLKSLTLVERLHRRLLDVIKDELDRMGNTEINSVQALLIFNIGNQEMTAGELRTRGHYLGSNVSYNLKKLVEAGYINHQRSDQDRRSVRVKLTDMGHEIREVVEALYDRHWQQLEQVADIRMDELEMLNSTLFKLERFWTDQIRFRL
jgi:DNA-binding MarR family transcriptional regulator